MRSEEIAVDCHCSRVPSAQLRDCPSPTKSQSSSSTVTRWHPRGCNGRWRRTAQNKQQWKALRLLSVSTHCTICSGLRTQRCSASAHLGQTGGVDAHWDWFHVSRVQIPYCKSSVCMLYMTWSLNEWMILMVQYHRLGTYWTASKQTFGSGHSITQHAYRRHSNCPEKSE